MAEQRRYAEQSEIVIKLLSVWQHYPELRLGQLIENVFGCHNQTPDQCIFSKRDKDIYKELDKVLKQKEGL